MEFWFSSVLSLLLYQLPIEKDAADMDKAFGTQEQVHIMTESNSGGLSSKKLVQTVRMGRMQVTIINNKQHDLKNCMKKTCVLLVNRKDTISIFFRS